MTTLATHTETVNRVSDSVDRMCRTLAQRLASGLTTDDKVVALGDSLDMPLDEFCKFQEIKSAATGDALTLDEAQTVYRYLGETPDHFNAQSVPVKAVLTLVFAELLKRRIGR